MEYIDISKFKRNPDKIRKLFKTVGDSTVATDNFKVMFPVRFVDKGLCSLDRITKVVGYYAIINESNDYAIVNIPAFQDLKPGKITLATIGGKNNNKDTYIVLSFFKDEVFLVNNSIVKDSNNLFNIVNEFFIKGNVPWYIDYEDLSNMLIETNKYTGVSAANNPLVFEVLTSIIARDSFHPKDLYKDGLLKNKNNSRPTYIGLSDIYLSYDDTGSRLVGSYFGQGLTNAIVDPETKTSESSKLLRA